MRTWMKVVLGIFVVLAAVIAIVFYATSGLTDIAEDFFQAIRAGDMERAETYLSTGFKRTTDREKLQAFIKANRLDRFSAIKWGGRSVKTSGGLQTGKLEGALELEDGETLPLTVRFLKEEDGWKIHAIEKDSGGISEGEKPKPVSHRVPANDVLVAMVNETTQLFGRSIKAGSMEEFYNGISDTWRRQTNVEELDAAFRVFIDADLDLTGIRGLNPVFDKEPSVDGNGILVVEGHYPSRPLRYGFRYKYLQEGKEWKLFGLNGNVKPVKPEGQPQSQ